MLAERAAAEEQEATKKYNGPVGKNPWGTIAEDWATHGRKGEKDFSEELGELANLVGGKKLPIFNRIGKIVVDESNEDSGKPNFSSEPKKNDPAQKVNMLDSLTILTNKVCCENIILLMHPIKSMSNH